MQAIVLIDSILEQLSNKLTLLVVWRDDQKIGGDVLHHEGYQDFRFFQILCSK